MDKEQKTEDILKNIVKQFGKQILDKSSSTQLEGLLSDMLAHDKGMLKLFRLAIKENIAHELLQCDALRATEKRIKVNSLKVKFKENNFLEESVAYQVVDCFAYALGWNIVAKKTVKPTPQPATEKKGTVEKKTTEPVREKETTRKTAVKTTKKRTATTQIQIQQPKVPKKEKVEVSLFVIFVSLVFGIGGVWLLFDATTTFEKFMSVFMILFFGGGGAFMLFKKYF